MTTPTELERLAVEQAKLERRYREPQRRYHDLAHVHQVLGIVELLTMVAADVSAVRLAAWFHDAVYEPARDDNEQRSADLAAETLLALGADHALVQEVARLVLVTEDHRPDPDDRNAMVLSDADLSILAADPDDYDAYAAAVRAEYAHVADEAFARGRTEILLSVSGREHIYATHWGREHLDAPARANLARELESLSATLP
ncbi:MAG: metal-dependent phosphohydrolase [Actinomycetota bacterium]|nr:metal-dependent phosphohydrolase [Actinomycetota bacterium]